MIRGGKGGRAECIGGDRQMFTNNTEFLSYVYVIVVSVVTNVGKNSVKMGYLCHFRISNNDLLIINNQQVSP